MIARLRLTGKKAKLFLLICGLSLLVCMGVLLLNVRRSWEQRRQLEARGAQVINAGYGPTGIVNRVPIFRHLFIRSQVEVFLPDTEVAASVLELLRDFPQCKRIWIHRDNVDPDMADRVRTMRPDVDFIRYTRQGDAP